MEGHNYEVWCWGSDVLYVDPNSLALSDGTILCYGSYGLRWMKVDTFQCARGGEPDAKR
jgi:hypothetical protein